MFNIEFTRPNIFQRKKYLIDEILSGRRSVYIFGLTTYSNILFDFLQSNNIMLKGFIDDITLLKYHNKRPVFKIFQVPKDAIIISSVIEGRPKFIFKYLIEMGFKNIVDYFDFNFYNPKIFPIPFNNDNYDKITSNMNRLNNVYKKLEDELSKKIFKSVIDFRLNFNYNEQDFIYETNQQYFEDFIDKESIKVFLDAGGYDGSTSLIAIDKFPNLKEIYYFEPHPKSMTISRKKLENQSSCNIVFFENALSATNSFKYLTEEMGTANHLIIDGKLKVDVRTIDSLFNNRIDYIKFDIEGEELNALTGANNLIKNYRPTLAVCVYHSQSHFWEVPDYIFNIHSDYKIYLRHYTEGIYETVMYFL